MQMPGRKTAVSDILKADGSISESRVLSEEEVDS